MKQLRPLLIYAAVAIVTLPAVYAALRLGTFTKGAASLATAAAAQEIAASTSPLAAFQANLTNPLSQLFMQLLVVLVAARCIGSAFKRLGMPAVVGEMAAGILLGPSLFGLAAPGAFSFVFPDKSLGSLRLLSQVGVCLFMFAVGAEMDLTQLRRRAHSAVVVSHSSIVLPFVLGVALAYPLFDTMAGERATFTSFALFMGISMSITAFPVLARILQERGLTNSGLGNMALACAAVEDVTAWTILTFVVAIARAASLDTAVLSMVLTGAFTLVMSVGVRRVLRSWLSDEIVKGAEPSTGTLTVVICILIAASLCTEVLGIHAIFGAFLAGAIMPGGAEYRHRISALFSKFSSTLLLPLFFAFTGLRTQISLLDSPQMWLLCLLAIAVAIMGKLGAGAAAARLSGMGWKESLQLGALLNTRGLMELIALNIGYDLGILSARIFTILVIMALVTTMMTGPLLTLFSRRRASPSMQQDHSHA